MTVLGHDKFRSQAYRSRGTSTNTVTKPETEVQLPVSRRTKTSWECVCVFVCVGGGVFNVAFYIFQISSLDVGKWSLSRFKGNTSGIQQTWEMTGTDPTSYKLLNVNYRYACQYFNCCCVFCSNVTQYLAFGSI